MAPGLHHHHHHHHHDHHLLTAHWIFAAIIIITITSRHLHYSESSSFFILVVLLGRAGFFFSSNSLRGTDCSHLFSGLGPKRTGFQLNCPSFNLLTIMNNSFCHIRLTVETDHKLNINVASLQMVNGRRRPSSPIFWSFLRHLFSLINPKDPSRCTKTFISKMTRNKLYLCK